MSLRVVAALEIPELGSALGRVAVLPALARPAVPAWPGLEGIRFGLAAAVIDLVADARAWSAAGDGDAAVETLAPAAWSAAWEAAVRDVANHIAADLDARLLAAAQEARMFKRRRRRLMVTEQERRALTGRLASAGVVMAEPLDRLKDWGERLRETSGHDRAIRQQWGRALVMVAQRLESAWLGLEEVARREAARWQPVIERVRVWRRPMWPVWVLTTLLIGVAIYLGLVLGGYLPTPPFLRGFTDGWWSLWDRYIDPV